MNKSQQWRIQDGSKVFPVPTSSPLTVYLNGLRLFVMEDYVIQTGLGFPGDAGEQLVVLRVPTHDVTTAKKQSWWRRMLPFVASNDVADVLEVWWEDDDHDDGKEVMTMAVLKDSLQPQVCPKCSAEILPSHETIRYGKVDYVKMRDHEVLVWSCRRCEYEFETPCADAHDSKEEYTV